MHSDKEGVILGRRMNQTLHFHTGDWCSELGSFIPNHYFFIPHLSLEIKIYTEPITYKSFAY